MATHSPVFPNFVGYSRPIRHAPAASSALHSSFCDEEPSSASTRTGTVDPWQQDTLCTTPTDGAGSHENASPQIASYILGLLAALWCAHLATSVPQTQTLYEEWCMLAVLSVQDVPLELGYYAASRVADLFILAVHTLSQLTSTLVAMARAPFRPQSQLRAWLRALAYNRVLWRFAESLKDYAMYMALDHYTTVDREPFNVTALAVSALLVSLGGATWALFPGLYKNTHPVTMACVAAASTVPSYPHRLLLLFAMSFC